MQKIFFLPTYLPYFFQTITGNKQYFFLASLYEYFREKCQSDLYQQFPSNVLLLANALFPCSFEKY